MNIIVNGGISSENHDLTQLTVEQHKKIVNLEVENNTPANHSVDEEEVKNSDNDLKT